MLNLYYVFIYLSIIDLFTWHHVPVVPLVVTQENYLEEAALELAQDSGDGGPYVVSMGMAALHGVVTWNTQIHGKFKTFHVLGVITHILGVLKPSFFPWVVGVQGI